MRIKLTCPVRVRVPSEEEFLRGIEGIREDRGRAVENGAVFRPVCAVVRVQDQRHFDVTVQVLYEEEGVLDAERLGGSRPDYTENAVIRVPDVLQFDLTASADSERRPVVLCQNLPRVAVADLRLETPRRGRGAVAVRLEDYRERSYRVLSRERHGVRSAERQRTAFPHGGRVIVDQRARVVGESIVGIAVRPHGVKGLVL